ncbi:MAG TPA: SRPBCC domain-containing protein [Chitinophagaceae bacterium]|nr:SRPBCC domain-containing protein [Chitinophagaceae bacterium]
MTKTTLQQQIIVHALPSKVWKVLTNPAYVNQHLHDGNIICDWTEGSSIQMTASKTETKQLIYMGRVFETVPGMLLKFSFREGDTPTYIITTYELIVAGDGVELKIKCEGFNATQQEYLIRIQQANLLLKKIKWLAEYS